MIFFSISANKYVALDSIVACDRVGDTCSGVRLSSDFYSLIVRIFYGFGNSCCEIETDFWLILATAEL